MSGSHMSDRVDWPEYVKAAQRKVQMAQYHLRRLEDDADALAVFGEYPPISAQAHFEGVLYAFIAAQDQVAEAILRAFPPAPMQLPKGRRTLLDRALTSMPGSQLRRRIVEWRETPIVDDVRWVRKRATHHHYTKLAPGRLGFAVQKPTGSVTPYDGARELVEYARAAVEHAEDLGGVLAALKDVLSQGRA